MTNEQLEQLLLPDAFPEKTTTVTLVETHASWVLLTDQFAYKIKKPVKFSFLDFSTPEKRLFYCQRELVLNARLEPDVYLAVLNVVQTDTGIRINADGEVIDAALKMKRLDTNRQMDKLLEQNAVLPSDIEKIAVKLAAFHARADVITTPADTETMHTNFADILRIRDFLTAYLKPETFHVLEDAVEMTRLFLNRHAGRLQERTQHGFVVDGHGDLHAGNIFLLQEPVIFDCLEFNDDFRKVDMLDDLAFLCLNLDYYQHPDLEAHFLEHYLAEMPAMRDAEDRRIFNYYKLYRANVRLKVAFLKAKQHPEASKEFHTEFGIAQRYFQLFEQYLHFLE